MRGAIWILVLGAAAAAQDIAPPAERESFGFVIYGDRTGGRPDGVQVLETAVAATNRLDPDFTISVGDMVQGYSDGKRWLAQVREYKAVMNRLKRPWYPCAGNHDVYGGRDNKLKGNVDLYQEHFGPLWYSFDYKWAHFIVLFSDEMLSFSNPSVTQNMSPKQLAWLAADLKATKAKQVFVFLHHPRWTYRGTNWPKVHEVLAADGRVRAVFAGHIHVYRDDGTKDGIHYYTLAVTGGHAGRLKTPASLHHLNYVKVRPDGFTMSVHPVGAVLGSDVVHGPEVDRLNAMRSGDWLAFEGGLTMQPGTATETGFKAIVSNPAPGPVSYELRLHVPGGWPAEPRFVGGVLEPGGTKVHGFLVKAPRFTGRRPEARLHAILRHPLRSGLVQPVHHTRAVPVRITGVPSRPTRKNGFLVLDGKSAVRIDGPFDFEEFTLECWVKGSAPKGSQAVVTKTEGSGFGLWWSYGDAKRPYGVVGYRGKGYTNVGARADWDWGKWTHLAVTSGGGKARFFVNGKLQAEAPAPGPRSRNHLPFFVGADPDGRSRPGRFFKGAVDEVRLSRVVRYEKDFKPKREHRRDADTLFLLHFDRKVHGLFPDDSGHDRHGWPHGHPKIAD